ncbi:MAG: 5-(carboxyamino)imidazole ribonucleotide synthase [Bdellovibrionales bacterium]|nr:5-(carboxyamino)imidazole ribonucleotide synthase [Bdellovibrionales bacterium]
MKVGILGGGQLAQMMALKAHELGIKPYVLSSDKNDPAAQVTPFWIKGDIQKLSDLTKFLKKTDIVTFENEFVPTNSLIKAMRKTKTPVRPHPRIIAKLQDRWFQKQLLKKYNIPTSPFFKIDNKKQTLKAFEIFNGRMVLKKRLFGYDGKGTFIVTNIKQIPREKNLIAEKFVPFKRELALILAVGKNQIISLPLVETFQKDFRCYWVKGPVSHPKINTLTKKLKTFLRKIKYQGVIAFEIFETPTELLVNEIAPRVHNSGHYSLDALSKDQFSLHLQAVMGKRLQSPKTVCKGFAMLNLLGKKERSKKWKKIEEVYLHDYGKKLLKKGRKMGHLNSCANSSKKALEKLFRAEKYFQS